jgi:hypothetical protein
MKRRKYYSLTFLAIVAFLLAIFVALVRLFFIPMLADDSLWALKHFYGPNQHLNVTYNDLYNYAMQNIQDRNSQVSHYLSIICILLIVFGSCLFWWSRDIKRISKSTSGGESPIS